MSSNAESKSGVIPFSEGTLGKLQKLKAMIEGQETTDACRGMYDNCLKLLERENRGKQYTEQSDAAGRNVEFVPVDRNGKPLPNGQRFSAEVVAVYRGPRENDAIDVHVTTTDYDPRAPRIGEYLRLYPWGNAEIRLPDLQYPLSESCTYSRPDQFLREPSPADIVFWNNTITTLAA